MVRFMTALLNHPCASRREARRLNRRDAILGVAATYFLEHGYAGTTMSGIAAALGGSKGTLWNHFPSKEALFAAVLDHRITALRDRLIEILDPCEDLRATLRRFCVGHFEKVTSDEAVALQRLVVAEAGRFPEMGQIFFERAPGMTRVLVGNFLSNAMERGLLRRSDPLAAANFLMHQNMSGCHQALLWGHIAGVTLQQIEEDAEAALDVFFRVYGVEREAAN
jgi:AcrR family transcriptional regulator